MQSSLNRQDAPWMIAHPPCTITNEEMVEKRTISTLRHHLKYYRVRAFWTLQPTLGHGARVLVGGLNGLAPKNDGRGHIQ